MRVPRPQPAPGLDLRPIQAGGQRHSKHRDPFVIVPEQALTVRKDRTGVFVVDEESGTARWREVTVGIREGDRVQIAGENLEGRVVTLGQQLIDDGSAVTIPQDQ